VPAASKLATPASICWARFGKQPRRKQQLGAIDRQGRSAQRLARRIGARLVVQSQRGRTSPFSAGDIPEVVQHLRLPVGSHLRATGQVQGLVEIPFGESELTAVGMEDSTIGEKPRFVQRSPARRSSGRARRLLNCLFKATDADVNEGTLYIRLVRAVLAGLVRPRDRARSAPRPGIRLGGVARTRLKSRLGRAYVSFPASRRRSRGVGVVWRRSAASLASTRPTVRWATDAASASTPRSESTAQCGCFSPERVVDNCREARSAASSDVFGRTRHQAAGSPRTRSER